MSNKTSMRPPARTRKRRPQPGSAAASSLRQRKRGGRLRRGNTIVLVVGILVLLVIIATSYVTRTHAGRVTAVSQQRAALRDGNAQVIGEMIADEIAGALFVRPVNPVAPVTGDPLSSNEPRLTPLRNPVRYSVDQDNDGLDGIPISGDDDGLPDVPFNFAPYHVVPFTNWPDAPLGGNPLWPAGPGNVGGGGSPVLAGEGNSLGNPGFGDARWLADIEPLRWDTDVPPDWIGDAFSHWRHLTNIARPENGWRVVADISDVGNSLVRDLSIPVEQWLALPPFALDGGTGDGVYDPVNFKAQWLNWFGFGPFSYQQSYTNSDALPNAIPVNFYNLNNLDAGFDFDGDGNPVDPYEQPQAEFERNTARWNVSRVMADADGDGFTDSFWFLAPTMIEGGIRQIAAVRIVDNSALLNANVATRFLRNDVDFGVASKTRGHTPADLALVGELGPGGAAGEWNVGFYDNSTNWFPGPDYVTAYDLPFPSETVDRDFPWRRHVMEVGLIDSLGKPILAPDIFQRLDYWRQAGLAPVTAAPGSGYSPFTLADELELRMFHGQNYPWIFSRLEYSTQSVQANRDLQFLRASVERRETSEYLDQLSNRELLADNRRKLTLFNGARNDLMPPWLWPNLFPVDVSLSGVLEADELQQYRADMKKLDLRRAEHEQDVDNDGQVERGIFGNNPLDDDLNNDTLIDARDHHLRLRGYLEQALMDGAGGYYFDGDEDTTRELAASLAANIAAYRDEDSDAPVAAAVAVSVDPTMAFLGVERQPFLLEAFIGHVHASEAIPTLGDPLVDPQYDGFRGNYVNESMFQTTIVVVQIANPFNGEPRRDVNVDGAIDEVDKAIDLHQYSLNIFGQQVDLDIVVPNTLEQRYLRPGTEERPRTAIFYSIQENFDGEALFGDRWRDFLDLGPADHYSDPGDLTDHSILVNITGPNVSFNRDTYDLYGGGYAIELLRKDPFDPLIRVVVDRFDYDLGHPDNDEFLITVKGLFKPPPEFEDPVPPPPQLPLLSGIRIGEIDDHWVTWARVTRAWGDDFDYDPTDAATTAGIQPVERAPRFVFAGQEVTRGVRETLLPLKGDMHAIPPDEGPDRGCGYCGDSYATGDDPNTPWFSKPYTDATGAPRTRKPTFFTMNPVYIGGVDIYPPFNNQADPTHDYGNFFYGTPYVGNPPGAGIPDKGFYGTAGATFDHSLQMLQKDADFEQVGELLNVWLFGHQLDVSGTAPVTTKTFSEFMADTNLVGDDERVNRLRMGPVTFGGSQISPVIGIGAVANLSDPLHSVPALPAGLRVLDAFVCDGGGMLYIDHNGDGVLNEADLLHPDYLAGRFLNANGFSGGATPGLVNINTAPVEVLRALPHSYQLVHEVGMPTFNPRVRLPETIERYRERFDAVGPTDPRPDYFDRDDVVVGLRPERGLASIGEVMLLMEVPATGTPNVMGSWRVDFAGSDPFDFTTLGRRIESTRISSDVINGLEPDPINPGQFFVHDSVASDVEERNLLFAGISNLITTRSDMFTVYFKVRSFRQNPVTGVWDATNPEYIVDDSRYVMLVDRSEVNTPNDKPRILYLEKLPK